MSSHQEYSPTSETNLLNNASDILTIQSTKLGQILLVLHPFMIITGVICNTLIFMIMGRRPMSRISTYYYMRILALVDTIVLLLGLTNIWLYLINPKWPLLSQSTFTCRVLSLILYTTSDMSEWIICLISIDHCIAVVRPLHASSGWPIRRAQISLCILLPSMLMINAHFLFTHYLSAKVGCAPYERYEFFTLRVWTWIDAIVYAFLPFLLLLIANSIITHSILQTPRLTSDVEMHQSASIHERKKSATLTLGKQTAMLLAVTFFSLLAAFPAVCLGLYIDLHQGDVSPFIRLYVRPLSITLQFTNHYVSVHIC